MTWLYVVLAGIFAGVVIGIVLLVAGDSEERR